MPKAVLRAASVTLLHVEPALDAATDAPRLLLWLDVAGQTVKVMFDEYDARHLVEGARASLETFDERRDPTN